MNNLTFDDKVFLIYLRMVGEQKLGLPERTAKQYAKQAFLLASYAQEQWDEMIAETK